MGKEGELIVTERGQPVARLLPPRRPPFEKPFLKRKLLPGVARLLKRPIAGLDSTEIISEGRNGR